ncbi:MAG TPA: hypothetical protein VGF94_16075 [Kofleriaceae bacterium]|jgi:hypothetical protein
MISNCDLVAERVALGEPLGELAEHATGCARCRRLAALPAELGSIRSEVDPGLGFAARLTAGAQHRLGVRRRRRIAAGLAGTVVAAAAVLVVVTHQPAPEHVAIDVSQLPRPAVKLPHDPWSDPAPAPKDRDGVDPDVRTLVHFARGAHAHAHAHASWARIVKPLSPYDQILDGGEP